MNRKKSSVFSKTFSPAYQGITVLLLYFIIIVILHFLQLLDWLRIDAMDYWKYASSIILFYILLNCAFCFSTKHKLQYYRDSIITYIFLLFLLSIICKYQSNGTIWNAESYSWIWMVFSFIFLVLLTIINLSRKIVELAIKQDQKLNNEK